MFINCKGELLDLTIPKIMGILNLTPDSFYDGGKYSDEITILSQVEKMSHEGVNIIDIGGYSSRPNATHISEKEEINRVLPILKNIVKHFPNLIISIDTFRSEIAKICISEGASMINDISAGNLDSKMFETIALLQVPYIITHMKGTPQNMQENPTYQNITKEIILYFSKKIYQLNQLGVNDIIIDVGFGFGKTIAHNFELLHRLDLLKNLDCPILTGLSRKSMIYKTLNCSPQEALNGTTVLHTIALQKGSNLLRVHDVKEAKEIITLLQQ